MIRTGSLALLTLALVAGPARAQETASPPPISGYWIGGYEEDDAVQALVLEIEEGSDGLVVLATIPDHGTLKRPLDDASYSGGRLTFDFANGFTELDVDLERGEMIGTAVNDQESVDVNLRRVAPPVEAPFVVEAVRFGSGDVTMAGSLVLPEGEGPHPAIVFVAGRSYGERWGAYSEAVRLAQHGIAALVFDGRGRGESGGDRETTTDEDRYGDALAALELVQSRSEIDRDRIGLWSESAGAWVAPEVARRAGGVAFLILQVPPAESLAEQQGHVVEYRMRWFLEDEGFTESDFEDAYAYQKRLVELAWEDADWPTVEAHVATAEGERWARFVDRPESLEDRELDYFRRRRSFDPSEALRETTVPVLALYGERDFVVPPPPNVPRLQALLDEAGNGDVTIVVFPDADHGLDVPIGVNRWRRQAPGFHDAVYEWLDTRIGVAEESRP